jgi:hypothetical protein
LDPETIAEFEQELTDNSYIATDKLTETDFNYTIPESKQDQDHNKSSEVTDTIYLVTTLLPE